MYSNNELQTKNQSPCRIILHDSVEKKKKKKRLALLYEVLTFKLEKKGNFSNPISINRLKFVDPLM
jgi:hypothetical protein